MIKLNKSFIQLKKNCKKDISKLLKFKIAVLGDSATQHLSTALKGYAYDAGLGLEIFDSDYNQIDAQIMDKQSELYSFCPYAVLIYMCTEKLYEEFCLTSESSRNMFAETVFNKIQLYWELLNQQINTNILQLNFAEADDRVFGNFSNKTDSSFIYQLRKLNILLMDGCRKEKNVFLIDLSYIQNRCGRDLLFEDKLYYIAKMPISTAVLPMVVKETVDVIKALSCRAIKCVILDLDNTLWGGVIGDDGLNGIEIGDFGIGHAFFEFQKWLKELKKRGIILAVCSKNNEATAKEPFLHHPDMLLRLDDFSIFIANWDDKATNIKAIQKTLNIGMDSIVFIDDNAFERNLVRSLIPEIIVPELPDDPALYLSYLKSLNLFEVVSYSEEDKNRTEQYQDENKRMEFQIKYESYEDYLNNLEMCAETNPFDVFHYPRIAQLTQRSNQFNLRTVRYNEADIARIANDDRCITLYFKLKDKFGDYGLISIVILEKKTDDTLFIDSWLMSCRVLKRGMEEFVINKVMYTAKNKGFSFVVGEYIKTPKNSMVESIFERMNFIPIGQNRYQADVETYTGYETFIKES